MTPKRGRPRKHPLPPEPLDGEPVVKRKRGRPRKHPLPPEPLDGEPVVKQKRGRPRKHPLPPEPLDGEPVVKRKRGRPRKHPLPQSEVMAEDSEAQSRTVASSEQPAEHVLGGQPLTVLPAEHKQVVGTPVKRGRGRPRKNPLPEVKNGHAIPISGPLAKKGRGRPRKNISMVTVVAETTETSEVNVDTIEGSETPLPKGNFRLEVSFSESDSEGELVEMGREAIKALADRVVEESPRVNIDPDFEESFDESSST